MHLLYLNGQILHDCADMDDKNIHFSDIIKVKFSLFPMIDKIIIICRIIKVVNEIYQQHHHQVLRVKILVLKHNYQQMEHPILLYMKQNLFICLNQMVSYTDFLFFSFSIIYF